MPNTTTAADTCACCLRTIVLGKGTSPKRHGWSVQGNRSVGSYGNSWHTGPCPGVRFPHLHESPDGARYMIAQLRERMAGLQTARRPIEARETSISFTDEVSSQFFNAAIIRSHPWDSSAKLHQDQQLANLAAEWMSVLCPMGVDVRRIELVPCKRRGARLTAHLVAAPAWAGGTIKFGGWYMDIKVPSYEELRRRALADLDAQIARCLEGIATFERALTEHGW